MCTKHLAERWPLEECHPGKCLEGSAPLSSFKSCSSVLVLTCSCVSLLSSSFLSYSSYYYSY